eukprot:scaffold5678_cov134-Skeletonema_menzelii.AAC.3
MHVSYHTINTFIASYLSTSASASRSPDNESTGFVSSCHCAPIYVFTSHLPQIDGPQHSETFWQKELRLPYPYFLLVGGGGAWSRALSREYLCIADMLGDDIIMFVKYSTKMLCR